MIDLSRLRLALLRRRAAGTVEYGALAALIAVAAIGTVTMAGTRIVNLIERAADGDGVGPSFVWSGGGPLTPSSGTTATQTFFLTNTGSIAGTPNPAPAVSTSTPGVSLAIGTNTCTASVAPGASCQVQVTATYSAPATLSGTLSAGGATQALTGVYAGQPQPVLSGTNLFTNYQSGHVFTLTLTNNSATAPMTLTARSLPIHYYSGLNGSASFASGTTCTVGLTIQPGGSCVFKIIGSVQPYVPPYAFCGEAFGHLQVRLSVTVSGQTLFSDVFGWIGYVYLGSCNPPGP
jgi:hypothetical protein